MDSSGYFDRLARETQSRFDEQRTVLSFPQYLDLFIKKPALLARSSAQYLKDAVDSFGTYAIPGPEGEETRFKLFDAPFDDGRDRLVGQEEVQRAFYDILSNFVREGRTGRFVLLHGPNGSAKTSFVQCLSRALVHYSRTDDGAVYSFSWVFPRNARTGKRVGFHQTAAAPESDEESYAFTPQDDVAALMPGELRDTPLFLIPKDQRVALLSDVENSGKLPEAFRFSNHVLHGDLGPTSRRIFDTLLTAYGGDMKRVLAHVRVERYEFSRRYRRGLVTIEPQMHVDADLRQVTLDESYSNLPAILRHLSFSQLSGDLVDANRGLIEFDDLLKRPLDSFKYLMGTCESSRVSVGNVIIYLDVMFIGTSNDKYVMAFTKLPEFPSFKGRMEFVRVPYLRNYRVEQGIYDMQLTRDVVGKHIAPHATHVAALWAVLSRLRRPNPDYYPNAIRSVMGALTPLEKADLYAFGSAPAALRPEVAKEVTQYLPQILAESHDQPEYEGGSGASPREVKGLLLNAAQAPGFPCLHPVRVLDEIFELTKMKAMYEFLQAHPDGEFGDPVGLWSRTCTRYARLVEREFKSAMGLVTDEEFEKLLQKYAQHSSAWIKKEYVIDPITRREVPPDTSFLEEIEGRWEITEDRDRIRQEYMGRIASFYLDNPGKQPSFGRLFADQFEKLRKSYYSENQPEYQRALRLVLDHLAGMPQEPQDEAVAKNVVATMIERYGYCRSCVGPAVSFLVNEPTA